jgi:hypothetical protein
MYPGHPQLDSFIFGGGSSSTAPSATPTLSQVQVSLQRTTLENARFGARVPEMWRAVGVYACVATCLWTACPPGHLRWALTKLPDPDGDQPAMDLESKESDLLPVD